MTSNIYDLTSPFVSATAPAPATAAAPAKRTYWTRAANDRLFNGSVILLIFAGVLVLLGGILGAAPIGQLTLERDAGQWLAVFVAMLALAGIMTLTLAATVKGVRA